MVVPDADASASPPAAAAVAAGAAAAAGAVVPPDEDTFRILVATDVHLGYLERDGVRGDDSFDAFEELMREAVRREVDFVLLGGDLFHENKPSRQAVFRCMEIMRRYCFGDRSVRVRFLSDPGVTFRHGLGVNYEDANMNIALPVFSIHGNHDDPSGQGMHAPLDLLSMAGLVNYFGRQDSLENIELFPLLLQKGKTQIALYGIGSVSDERLHRLFVNKRVKLLRPVDGGDEIFNVLVLHQNRAQHSQKGCIREDMLDGSALDLVIWGHEHECRIQGEPNENFWVLQPGSTVATSLIEGEARPKHVAVLHVCGTQFGIEPVPLRSVRPLVLEDVTIVVGQCANEAELQEHLRSRVEDILARVRSGAVHNSENGKLPLVRLRVDTGALGLTCSSQRFGHDFVGRVANPSDMLLFRRARGPGGSDSDAAGGVPRDGCCHDDAYADLIGRAVLTGGDTNAVEQLVNLYLLDEAAVNPMRTLSTIDLGDAVRTFVTKDDERASIRDAIDKQIEAAVHEGLLGVGVGVGMGAGAGAAGTESAVAEVINRRRETLRSQLEAKLQQQREERRARMLASGVTADAADAAVAAAAAAARAVAGDVLADDSDGGAAGTDDDAAGGAPPPPLAAAAGAAGRAPAATRRGAARAPRAAAGTGTGTARRRQPAATAASAVASAVLPAAATAASSHAGQAGLASWLGNGHGAGAGQPLHQAHDGGAFMEEAPPAVTVAAAAAAAAASTAAVAAPGPAPRAGAAAAAATTTAAPKRASSKRQSREPSTVSAATRRREASTLSFAGATTTGGRRTDITFLDSDDDDAPPAPAGLLGRGGARGAR